MLVSLKGDEMDEVEQKPIEWALELERDDVATLEDMMGASSVRSRKRRLLGGGRGGRVSYKPRLHKNDVPLPTPALVP
ncbi:hypothetical protein N7492_003449 [Penicillium capsulatum]|uniref:Uncharacterized protein n=1 Tax=Penicillium capsulatum TaxID=69766 RepID=A0A9W9IJM1_9EURO|nr:hypothetical protein N7492_003449 [Penicillium capsulatum]